MSINNWVFNKTFISHATKLLLVVFIMGLTGCGHYLYSESETSLRDDIKDPQVTKTRAYKLMDKETKTVGIIAPDSCRKQSGSTQQSDFIRSLCGVQVGMVEKALLKSGFEVVSWKTIQRMPMADSIREVGRDLGIDIFFSINSLENIKADASNISFKRTYYKSNKSGKKGVLWNIGEPHKSIITKKLLNLGDSPTQSLGAAIDITAIEVKTGKAIWYYEATFYKVKNKYHKTTALFKGKKRAWTLLQINGKPINHRDFSSATEEMSKKSNIGDDVYLKYLKIAVSSFVQSFKSGS